MLTVYKQLLEMIKITLQLVKTFQNNLNYTIHLHDYGKSNCATTPIALSRIRKSSFNFGINQNLGPVWPKPKLRSNTTGFTGSPCIFCSTGIFFSNLALVFFFLHIYTE